MIISEMETLTAGSTPLTIMYFQVQTTLYILYNMPNKS